MTALVPVILVRELPPARSRLRQHLASIRELVRARPSEAEPAHLSYLAQGVVCGIYNDRGLLFDVLQPGRRIDTVDPHDPAPAALDVRPGLVLTDGVWVWPGELPYYVGVYHLRLPERFLRFAQEHHWRIDPSMIDPKELSWDAYDAIPEISSATARSASRS